MKHKLPGTVFFQPVPGNLFDYKNILMTIKKYINKLLVTVVLRKVRSNCPEFLLRSCSKNSRKSRKITMVEPINYPMTYKSAV